VRRHLIADAASGLPVSAVCLATEHFGTAVDAATSFAILDRFAEAGGNFLDTVGPGEQVVGEWLARERVRDEFVVAATVRPAASAITDQAEASLRRLRTDRIDLCYAQDDDPTASQAEPLKAFAALITRGSVRMVGCGHFTAQRLRQARAAAHRLGLPPYRCVQQRHTYLIPQAVADPDQPPYATADLLELVRSEPDLTLVACSPLLSGAYVRSDRTIPTRYLHIGTPRRIAVLHEVAGKLGATPNQVVLAWLLASDPPALPVLGVSSPAQLDEALAALDLDLTPQQLARLDRAGLTEPATRMKGRS